MLRILLLLGLVRAFSGFRSQTAASWTTLTSTTWPRRASLIVSSSTKVDESGLNMVSGSSSSSAGSFASREAIKINQLSTGPASGTPPKNLKIATGTSLPDGQTAAILGTWNELQGLSEKELLMSYNSGLDSNDRLERALSLANKRCEYVTQLFSKTFYMGTSLMRPDAREHVWAIYTWCRRTDDLVDSPRALLNMQTLEKDLNDWMIRLDHIWTGKPQDLFDLALCETVKRYPTLSIQPFKDMIAGMVMDVPGIGKDRYQNFDELYLYCYRVAGTVGLMTLPILGAAKGHTEEEATEAAIALGIGSYHVGSF